MLACKSGKLRAQLRKSRKYLILWEMTRRVIRGCATVVKKKEKKQK